MAKTSIRLIISTERRNRIATENNPKNKTKSEPKQCGNRSRLQVNIQTGKCNLNPSIKLNCRYSLLVDDELNE